MRSIEDWRARHCKKRIKGGWVGGGLFVFVGGGGGGRGGGLWGVWRPGGSRQDLAAWILKKGEVGGGQRTPREAFKKDHGEGGKRKENVY